jgi:hypothetical protein
MSRFSGLFLPFRFSDSNFACIPHLFHACFLIHIR